VQVLKESKRISISVPSYGIGLKIGFRSKKTKKCQIRKILDICPQNERSVKMTSYICKRKTDLSLERLLLLSLLLLLLALNNKITYFKQKKFRIRTKQQRHTAYFSERLLLFIFSFYS
jgi:hypothetical protein